MKNPVCNIFIITTLLLCCFSINSNAQKEGSELIDSLKHCIVIAKIDTAKANTYFELSKCYWYDYPDTAIFYANQSMLLSNKNNYQRGVAFANYSIGVSYVWKEEFHNALQYTRKGLQIGKQISDSVILSYCYQNMGVIYCHISKYPEGLQYFYTSLRIADQLKIREVQVWSYMNLGAIFYNLDNKTEGIKYDSLLLKSAVASGNKKEIAQCYLSFGRNQADGTNYIEALKNIEAALEIFEIIGAKNSIGNCYLTKGFILRLQGKYNDALEYFFKEVKMATEVSSDSRLASVYHEVGLVYQSQNKFADAYHYYINALQFGLKAHDWINVTGVYKGMIFIDSASGNYKQMMVNQNLYFTYIDSLKNAEQIQKITEQQMQYDFDKKEAASKAEQDKKNAIALEEINNQRNIRNFSFAGIALLILFGAFTYNRYLNRKKLSNQLSTSLTELKQTQSQLIQLEKEKEAEAIRLRISRDIHDDIGSNLTKIALLSNLTTMQGSTINAETTENLVRISNYSRDVNQSLSEIIWAVNPKHDTLKSMLSFMRIHIDTFFENTSIAYQINFPTDVEDTKIDPDIKRNIFLVLKESLNNILKYAQANNVSIQFIMLANGFEMQIQDDGIGFTSTTDPQIIATNSGNGLYNMQMRMQQIQGTFDCQTAPGKGTLIKVTASL